MKIKNSNITNQVIKLRKSGNSYKKISDKLKISKSTAYKYTKWVKISISGKNRIERNIKRNQEEFSKKYSKEKKIKISKVFGVRKARIISHCLFDGSVTKYNLNYANSSYALIKLFIGDMKKIYHINPSKINKIDGKNMIKYVVWYYSKKICEDLFRYTPSYSTSSNRSRIPNEILENSKNLMIEFVRAFWEDEGCITIKGEILGRIKSRKVRDQLKHMHKLIGIECTIYNCLDGAFGLRILRNKKNIKKFKKIGFKDSIIVRGKNVGTKKIDLLKGIYKKY